MAFQTRLGIAYVAERAGPLIMCTHVFLTWKALGVVNLTSKNTLNK
jgi:hypothetical protein